MKAKKRALLLRERLTQFLGHKKTKFFHSQSSKILVNTFFVITKPTSTINITMSLKVPDYFNKFIKKVQKVNVTCLSL